MQYIHTYTNIKDQLMFRRASCLKKHAAKGQARAKS